jgi:cation diffusion facilitator family transporter
MTDYSMDAVKSAEKVRALQLAFVAIATVVVVEGVIGVVTNSLAILSDSAHALFDTLTSLILLVTTRISLKPPDEEHLYGHGKLEPIGGFVGGIALIAIAILLLYEAITRILMGPDTGFVHNPIGFVAVGYTLAVDFFRMGTLWGRGRASVTVKASLYHAVSDFASTVIALVGFGLTLLGGDDRTDAIASIVLAFLLIYLSVGLVRSSGADLSDQISTSVVDEVRKEILKTEGVSLCKDLKVRRVGAKTFVETTICVPSSMGLPEAHAVASNIEKGITRLYGDSSVTVHIEPEEGTTPVETQIEKLAAGVEGVKGVHNMSSVYSNGRLFITLHVMVDPAMRLEEAHGIAEKIEQKLKQKANNVGNITVHIEPYQYKLNREYTVGDAQVERMARNIVALHPSIRGVKRIVTYVSEKRRHINIDCIFEKSVSVEEMHSTASHVEAEIRNQFKEAVVTIHAEPAS